MNDVAQNAGHKPFLHPFTLKIRDAGIFKIGMLALGITIGAYWHEVFGRGLPILIVVAVASLSYITYVYCRE
jgi:hypothetical protein